MTRRAFWLLAVAGLGCRRRRRGTDAAAPIGATASFTSDTAPTIAATIPGPPTLVLVVLGVAALALWRHRGPRP